MTPAERAAFADGWREAVARREARERRRDARLHRVDMWADSLPGVIITGAGIGAAGAALAGEPLAGVAVVLAVAFAIMWAVARAVGR